MEGYMNLYRGVVEDNNHPKQNKMVRVRIYGIHTENNEKSGEFEQISSSQLPWAEVAGGTDLGLISGKGISSILKKGTMVWVFLENNDPNKPVVLGTVAGTISEKKSYNSGEGFCDPDGVYPISSRVGESDINEIARGVISNTVIATKNASLDTSEDYSESAQAASSYPNNDVIESAAGHMIELDNTSGNERVQIIDSRGNYMEMKLDAYIEKAVNDKVNIVVKNLIEHINGGVKEQVDLDYFKKIAGYFKIQADGNLEIINDVKITGNLEITEKTTSGGNITSKAEVADQFGNLSSLRDAYDSHYHIGNLGVPTANPTTTDPRTRVGDYTWTHTPLGFA